MNALSRAERAGPIAAAGFSLGLTSCTKLWWRLSRGDAMVLSHHRRGASFENGRRQRDWVGEQKQHKRPCRPQPTLPPHVETDADHCDRPVSPFDQPANRDCSPVFESPSLGSPSLDDVPNSLRGREGKCAHPPRFTKDGGVLLCHALSTSRIGPCVAPLRGLCDALTHGFFHLEDHGSSCVWQVHIWLLIILE